MFSSFLRNKQQQSGRRVHVQEDPEVLDSPSPGPAHQHHAPYAARRHATADFTEADDDDDDSNEDGIGRYQLGGDGEDDEDGGPGRRLPILPLFSAAYLGRC
jgi:hypothetical protein